MNLRQVLALSAIAWAGVAAAQTVPAEAWVGAPIPMTTGTLSRSAVTADYMASASTGARAPQELRVGPADIFTGALSRTEAVADLNLWLRAGLGQVAYREGYDPMRADNRARMAAYQRMRHGPEFATEVARLEGKDSERTAARLGRQPAAE